MINNTEVAGYLAEEEIVLTPQQQQVVDNESEEQLVRGIAGSGKTLVLLKKAKKKAVKNTKDTIMIFTYANSLTNASQITMKRHSLGNLNVSTFHSWAMKVYRQIFKSKFDLIKGKARIDMVKEAIVKTNNDYHSIKGKKDEITKKKTDHRFVTDGKHVDFLQKEISFIKGMEIRSMSEYAAVSRRGRGAGTRVTAADRGVIFDIFMNYEQLKGENRDFDDFAYLLLAVPGRIPLTAKIDHIFVDEAQDLQLSQIRLLKQCVKKTITIAADKGQKIYDTAFSWIDAGLNIQGGRTKILKESHRSTRQVIELAVSLQQNDSITQDEEYVAPVLPERTGHKPVLRRLDDKEHHDAVVLAMVGEILKDSPNATIGILYRSAQGWEHRLASTFKRKKMPYMDVRANKDVDPFSPGVKFTTFHSAKGLEFDIVILVDLVEPTVLPTEDGAPEFWDDERRLLYVAMTRAKSLLYMLTYKTENRLLLELDESLYDIQ